MLIEFIDRSGNERLALIFTGWATGPALFKGIGISGYDIAVVYDYTTLDATWLQEIERYREIAIVGWSYGVHSAALFMQSHSQLPITACIAVNGTNHPVDPARGIPPEIFSATLDGLNDRTLQKFMMRMCGGAASYAEIAGRLNPGRPVDRLKAELSAIGQRPHALTRWDKAIVADSDLIIPTPAQINAWEEDALQTVVIPGPHLPDFPTLLHGLLTDKPLVRKRFSRADGTYDDNAVIQHEISDRLLSLTPPEAMTGDVLEIGPGTGRATHRLLSHQPRSLTVWDLHLTPAILSLDPSCPFKAIETDAETAIRQVPDGSLSLIFSSSTVQWFNSLPRFLSEAARTLKPGGVMALSTYGPSTMREVTGGESRFPSAETLFRMLPAGTEILCFLEVTHTVNFSSPIDVLRHIRETGVNALDGSQQAHRRALRLTRTYPLRPDGSAPLTYQPIFIILRKPLQ
ncbi:MAG: DUF452 family protein [Muribaculaceae bacterium]|nr:DUF452 family protein [Muribaculaceae bacterium]